MRTVQEKVTVTEWEVVRRETKRHKHKGKKIKAKVKIGKTCGKVEVRYDNSSITHMHTVNGQGQIESQ